MPHVSKHKLKEKTERDIEDRLMLFLNTTTLKTRKGIFDELFTKTERLMIAKRLAILFLVNDGLPTHTISERLRVSPSTVARFENSSRKGRFKTTISWLAKNKIAHSAVRFIADLVSVPFDAQKKSLYKVIDESL